MRKIFIIIVFLLTMCNILNATSLQIDYCDTTSYIYMLTQNSKQDLKPDWIKVKSNIETENTQNQVVSVSVPKHFGKAKVPTTAKINGIEFYENIGEDSTAIIYMGYGSVKIDSLCFSPFCKTNIANFSNASNSFGIKAKYINHKLPIKHYFTINLGKEKVKEKYPWQIIYPIILSILLVLIAKYYQTDYIERLFMMIFYYNSFQNGVSERNVNAEKSGILLFINSIINHTLLLTIVIYKYNYTLSTEFLTAFLLLTIGVGALYLIKKLITNILANLFGCKEISTLYYKYVDYALQGTGIFLLCTNILSVYITIKWAHDFIFWLTVIGIAIILTLKIFRLIRIIIEKRFPIFYLFLYLCGVEFLPVLLIVKILSL